MWQFIYEWVPFLFVYCMCMYELMHAGDTTHIPVNGFTYSNYIQVAVMRQQKAVEKKTAS